MKTIKVIDLLNKIANGEEAPKKIKYLNSVYEYRGYMYCTENANYKDIDDYLFGRWNFNILNEEVIILEEEKKLPEKLYFHDLENITKNEKILVGRINSILDYLESKGE